METVLQNRRSGLEEREKILEAREATLTQREAAIASREEEAKETQKRLNVAAETLRSQWDRLMEEKERDKLFGVGPSGGQDDRGEFLEGRNRASLDRLTPFSRTAAP